MPYYAASFDLGSHVGHIHTISPHWSRSREPLVESARARAQAVFEAFEASPEAKALDDEPRWPVLVLREASLRHGMTIDTMTPEVFQEVSEIFVQADTIAAYAHWCGVVQEELDAFFRFLARTGFVHAKGCLEVLARITPVRERRYSRLIEASITPMTEEQAKRFAVSMSCSTSPPCGRVKPD